MQRKTVPEPPLAFGSMPDGSIDALLQFIDGQGQLLWVGVCLHHSFGQRFNFGVHGVH
jgi:hypothetical protein